jgi:hypothetical protein
MRMGVGCAWCPSGIGVGSRGWGRGTASGDWRSSRGFGECTRAGQGGLELPRFRVAWRAALGVRGLCLASRERARGKGVGEGYGGSSGLLVGGVAPGDPAPPTSPRGRPKAAVAAEATRNVFVFLGI